MCRKVVIAVFWIAVWFCLAVLVDNSILLVTPARAFRAFLGLLGEGGFYLAVGRSLLRIGTGFLAGFSAAVLLAAASRRFPLLEEVMSPVVSLAKAVPVASFVVLFLIWWGSSFLAVAICFLVVLPNIYISTLEGLKNADGQLLEMAQVFRVSLWNRFFYIYRPALKPFLYSSLKVSLGMCWKSGIAAEVIGIPDYSIGERMYLSKIYLDTAGVFAWTAVIVLLSAVFERAILWMAGRFFAWEPRCRFRRIQGGGVRRASEIKAKAGAEACRTVETKAWAGAENRRDEEAKAWAEAENRRDEEAKAWAEAENRRDAGEKARAGAENRRDAGEKARVGTENRCDAGEKVWAGAETFHFTEVKDLVGTRIHHVAETEISEETGACRVAGTEVLEESGARRAAGTEISKGAGPCRAAGTEVSEEAGVRCAVKTEALEETETCCTIETGQSAVILQTAIECGIRFANLVKSYSGRPVLSGISACYESGKTYYLTSPSGSGKTTLLRILAGLTEPDGGRVEASFLCSMVFQEDRLCNDYSAVKNVELVIGDGARAEEALGLLLDRDALHKPCSQLSGGMRRRVALVRAMEADSDYVLLDEPFTGMDAQTRSQAEDYIRKRQKGRTLLIATHI